MRECINIQICKEDCIKLFREGIRPPSRGNFYALTREVKFQSMGSEPPYPDICINMQIRGDRLSFISFQFISKIYTRTYTSLHL
jgi:hypothetical protein